MYIFVLNQSKIACLITHDGFVGCWEVNKSPKHFLTRCSENEFLLKFTKQKGCDTFSMWLEEWILEYSIVGMSVYGLWAVGTVRCND